MRQFEDALIGCSVVGKSAQTQTDLLSEAGRSLWSAVFSDTDYVDLWDGFHKVETGD